MTRHRELLESGLLADELAIFGDAERVIADPVVRNRGTIGGALCQADPAEDLSAVCAAIGARMVIRGLSGERVLAMRDFHLGPVSDGGRARRDARRDPRSGHAARPAAPMRRSTAGPATGRSPRPRRRCRCSDGVIARAGIALAAVGGDVSCTEAQDALVGHRPQAAPFAVAARLAAASCAPVSDQRGSVEYKRHVAGVLTERALRRAATRATAPPALPVERRR